MGRILLVIWGCDQPRELRQINTTGKSVFIIAAALHSRDCGCSSQPAGLFEIRTDREDALYRSEHDGDAGHLIDFFSSIVLELVFLVDLLGMLARAESAMAEGTRD